MAPSRRPSRSARPEEQSPRRPTAPARTAEFKLHHGALALFVEGRPRPALLIDVAPDTSAEQIQACAAANVHLYRLVDTALGWTGNEQSDFTALDARIGALLAADPEARFLLFVSVDAPEAWRQAHPGECVAYCLPAQTGQTAPPMQSWASRRWLNEAGEALARLVAHARRAEWEAHCLGCQIGSGPDGEWRYPEADRLPDIGPRMTERFRAFALDKYRRNTGLLRRAWADPKAEFSEIACPDADARRATDFGALRNPARSRRLLDYYECFYEAQNAAALHFCSIIKRASAGRMLVGLSYAPIFGRPVLQEGGHWFPERVLDSAEVDFLANAGPADGSRYLCAPTGSLALREKFLFHIPRGNQSPQEALALAEAHHAGLILSAATPPETLTELLGAARSALHPTNGGRSRRAAQVAVIVDPASILYAAPASSSTGWLNEALLNGQMRELIRVGAPFDLYLLADLFHARFQDYKVYVFLNSLYLSEAERRRVDARVKRSDQTAAWLWAPGVIGEEGIEAELGQRLCGQRLRIEGQMTNLRLRVVNSGDALTRGINIGTPFGLDRPLAPTVTIPDKSAMRLGANTAGKTAFSVRRFEIWTSVVYGAAPVPALLLKNLLRVE